MSLFLWHLGVDPITFIEILPYFLWFLGFSSAAGYFLVLWQGFFYGFVFIYSSKLLDDKICFVSVMSLTKLLPNDIS